VAFLGLAVSGCAGVVAQQAQSPEEQAAAARMERTSTSRRAEATSDFNCDNGKMLRSAFYWQGRHTASGERFNPDGLTAAHQRSRPIHAWLASRPQSWRGEGHRA